MSSTIKSVPGAVTDILMHAMDSDRTERVVMPFTRYPNVLNAPKVVKDVDQAPGAPFVFLQTDSEILSASEIRAICGDII